MWRWFAEYVLCTVESINPDVAVMWCKYLHNIYIYIYIGSCKTIYFFRTRSRVFAHWVDREYTVVAITVYVYHNIIILYNTTHLWSAWHWFYLNPVAAAVATHVFSVSETVLIKRACSVYSFFLFFLSYSIYLCTCICRTRDFLKR